MNAPLPDSVRIAELISKHLQGTLTNEEKVLLDAWITSGEEHQRLWEALNDAAMQQQYTRSMARYDETRALERFLEKHASTYPATIKPPVRSLSKWKWAVAAAAVIAVTAIAGYVWLLPSTPSGVVKNLPAVDVAPGKNGAILVLGNGTRVVLDSLPDGLVATQNGVRAMLKNGELVYTPDGKQAGGLEYNTISVPNGRQFHMTLPDGTQVWLNAASSMRYPIAFTGRQRQVEITGEAYFEVASLPQGRGKLPFIVYFSPTGGGRDGAVEVLGTHFNVNAYDNEKTVNTTLLEGSVRVSSMQTNPSGKPDEQVLLPGQQMQLSERRMTIIEADVDKVMAWKNGLFNFEGMDVEDAMKQIARWYDVEVVYRGPAPDIKFYGRINRNISLAGLIKGFQGNGIHLAIEQGRRLVVMP